MQRDRQRAKTEISSIYFAEDGHQGYLSVLVEHSYNMLYKLPFSLSLLIGQDNIDILTLELLSLSDSINLADCCVRVVCYSYI